MARPGFGVKVLMEGGVFSGYLLVRWDCDFNDNWHNKCIYLFSLFSIFDANEDLKLVDFFLFFIRIFKGCARFWAPPISDSLFASLFSICI